MASSGRCDQRVDAGGGGEAAAEQHQQQVARRPGDEAGDHCCAPLGEALQRRLQIAFGIDQEVGRDDDGLAVDDALADLDIAAAAMAELDVARLEPALSFIDKHRLTACRCRSPRFPERSGRARGLPVSISASTYMSGSSARSGLASSIRTRAVRVSLLICG